MHCIRVVDSHTGGEPTRVVLEGGPDLGSGTLAEQRERFRQEHDRMRSAIVNEPRGSDVVVGAMLLRPEHEESAAGVIFFNNVGMLGMCGHGTIGLVTTLAYLGRIQPGHHAIDTPVGTVQAALLGDGSVSVGNVCSRLAREGVTVHVDGWGDVTGDVAYGGNWFFLVEDAGPAVEPAEIPALTDFCWAVRRALATAGITGDDGSEIDHVEVSGPSALANSRNFVLCPGGAYDRSPCGTGTSAKIAVLAAKGILHAGDPWLQESITGSVFRGTWAPADGGVTPTINGRAWITAESDLLLDESDPLRWGIRT